MTHGPTLTPATELVRRNAARQPNESAAYRQAREALLAEEIELRRHIERVAEMRRALPPGGEAASNYRFQGEAGAAPVSLVDLFGEKDTLLVYNWMYGPRRARPCPMCTAFLSGLDGAVEHLRQRMAVAVVGLSPIERQIAFKVERGWRHVPLYADLDGRFSRDYNALDDDGVDGAGISVFVRDGEAVRLFWSQEMGPETADPGQDGRGAPDPMVLWTLLDLTPAGRGTDWYPKLSY